MGKSQRMPDRRFEHNPVTMILWAANPGSTKDRAIDQTEIIAVPRIAQPAADGEWSLVIMDGSAEIGREIRLSSGTHDLGRGDDVAIRLLSGSGMSRRHFTLEVGQTVSIRDCGSTNGTFVNGEPIESDWQVLERGDQVQAGSLVLRLTTRNSLDSKFLSEVYQGLATDALTGVNNRAYFAKRASEEVAWADRSGLPLALAVIDLDGFKGVNDQFGHEAGDSALCQVANLIVGTVRDIDVFARFGGDEFVLLMRDTDQQRAEDTAARLSRLVDEAEIKWHGHRLPIGISIGVVAVNPGQADGIDLDQMFRDADERMYKDKSRRKLDRG